MQKVAYSQKSDWERNHQNNFSHKTAPILAFLCHFSSGTSPLLHQVRQMLRWGCSNPLFWKGFVSFDGNYQHILCWLLHWRFDLFYQGASTDIFSCGKKNQNRTFHHNFTLGEWTKWHILIRYFLTITMKYIFKIYLFRKTVIFYNFIVTSFYFLPYF